MHNQPVVDRLKEFPTPIDTSVYEQAAALYAQRVGARALALYQVGNINYPGLSDLDLLLVVRDMRIDNVQFFSVYRRLPPRFHGLFLHEPFVVPLDCLDILRFTTHTRRQLLVGKDLASAITSESSGAEAWCRLFEGLCTHQAFLDNVRRTRIVRVRHMTAVANSLRFSIGFFDAIAATSWAKTYGSSLDTLKQSLLTDCLSEAVALQIFDHYYGTFQNLTVSIRERLSLPQTEDVVAYAKQFLRGDREVSGVDPEWARQRYQAIERYHAALARLKFSYGYLFFLAAYDDSVVKFRQDGFTARCLNGYYRLLAARS